ncbi:hypothetical protein VCHA53O466_320031 [Vibrio chagasii]|nr:hypothetical protein VCHA53O466_320031 [Vibrio chagasii]
MQNITTDFIRNAFQKVDLFAEESEIKIDDVVSLTVRTERGNSSIVVQSDIKGWWSKDVAQVKIEYKKDLQTGEVEIKDINLNGSGGGMNDTHITEERIEFYGNKAHAMTIIASVARMLTEDKDEYHAKLYTVRAAARAQRRLEEEQDNERIELAVKQFRDSNELLSKKEAKAIAKETMDKLRAAPDAGEVTFKLLGINYGTGVEQTFTVKVECLNSRCSWHYWGEKVSLDSALEVMTGRVLVSGAL